VLDIATWPTSDLRDAATEIDKLGLHREAYELEVFGLTVVPADRTGAAAACARAFARVCDLIEGRTGTRPDVETGSTHVDVFTPSLYHVIHEDPVFRELISHPMAMALATLVVGHRGVLAGTEVFMKGPATSNTGNSLNLGMRAEGLQLGLHSDNVTVPEPFPFVGHGCNVTWLLSDYTKEAGALAFVPGSHRLCRQPMRGEAVDQAVPVEAPAGSLVIWHINTWHGSYPRLVPGLRTAIAFGVNREYMQPHEPVRRDLTDEMIDEESPRFSRLAGRDVVVRGEEGPDYERRLKRPFRYNSYT
jgi:hypothetical protein